MIRARWRSAPFRLAAAALVAAAGAACESGGVGSIERGAESWAGAMERGDLEAALEWYERRAAFLPPGEEAVVGRSAVEERWRSVVDRFDVSFGWEVDTVDMAGTRLGYVYGRYRVYGVDHATGESFRVDDAFVQVWRRQRDGSWLIALDMWHPPAQEAAELPPAP